MSLIVDIKKKLKNFTLEVAFNSGDASLGILGPSGSGKSMSLKCIAGVETPDEGKIVLNGSVLYDSSRRINLRPQQRNVGILFQNYALFPNMSAAKNIACAVSGSAKEKQEAAQRLLSKFKLGELGGRYPLQLSGGQQQRVALARIFASRPEILLLDEPFSALDSYLKESMLLEMTSLLEDFGCRAVMVSHSLDEVFRLCDDLLVFDGGSVISHGKTRETIAHPQKVTTARLTGCKNIFSASKVSDDSVYVPALGSKLLVGLPLPDGLSHIGIHAGSLYPCGENEPNAIPLVFRQCVETPSGKHFIFYGSKDGGDEPLVWRPSKEAGMSELPNYLTARPDDILPLE